LVLTDTFVTVFRKPSEDRQLSIVRRSSMIAPGRDLEVETMNRRMIAVGIGVCVVAVGCSRPSSPAAPSAAAARSTNSTAAIQTHGEVLSAVIGSGAGIVNVTPTAAVDGSFSAQINVNVHDAPANTTFYVQRAPEIGRALGSDGICQRALGIAPWGPPAPNFVTFPLPGTGPLVTLVTSNGGAGAVHIDFAAPTITDGTRFDVMFRLVDSLTAPTNELRTACFTVEVK
jgi:hypothetical protein